jgi:hypothetical protein
MNRTQHGRGSSLGEELINNLQCGEVDLLKHCIMVPRGLNISCNDCTRWRKGGALWEQFLRKEKKGRK